MSVAGLFETMESQKDKYSITDWSVSQSTLEDVFFKVLGGNSNTSQETIAAFDSSTQTFPEVV